MNASAASLLPLVFAPLALSAQLPPRADTTARPIGLSEAVRLARRNAPQAVQARGTVRSNQAAVRSSYAAFLPTVSVSAGSARQFTGSGQTIVNQSGERVTIANAPWTYSNGLSLNVDLFDGGRRLYDVSAARANVASAEANEVAQSYQVALNVEQQFFNVLAARESEDAARAQLQQAQQQLRTSAAKVAVGAATISDSLRSVVQVGNAQLALLTAQNDLRVANASLTRLVGTPYVVTASPADTASAPLPPLDSATIVRLAERGPAVRQATASLSAARADRRSARAPYWPTLTAGYSRGGSGTDSRYGFGSDPFAYTGSLRFSLSYPLFNQLNREEAVVRADVAEEIAGAALRDARLSAQQSLTQYVGALQSAEQRVRIQTASVTAAREDLRVQQQRYQVGASTLLDVLTSQTTLNQAETALIQARYDARIARAQIEAIVGQPLAGTADGAR